MLQVILQAVTGGLPDGASAMVLVHGQLQADSGRTVDLGMSEPFFEQLSYGPDETRKLQLQPRWRVSAAAVERIEQVRAGGNFTLYVGVRYGLMGGHYGTRLGRSRTGRSAYRSPPSRRRSSSRRMTGSATSSSRGSRRRRSRW